MKLTHLTYLIYLTYITIVSIFSIYVGLYILNGLFSMLVIFFLNLLLSAINNIENEIKDSITAAVNNSNAANNSNYGTVIVNELIENPLLESAVELNDSSMEKQQSSEHTTALLPPITDKNMDNNLTDANYDTTVEIFAENPKDEISQLNNAVYRLSGNQSDDDNDVDQLKLLYHAFVNDALQDNVFVSNDEAYKTASIDDDKPDYEEDTCKQEHYKEQIIKTYKEYLALGGEKTISIDISLIDHISWTKYTETIHRLKDEIDRLTRLNQRSNKIFGRDENIYIHCDICKCNRPCNSCRSCRDCMSERAVKCAIDARGTLFDNYAEAILGNLQSQSENDYTSNGISKNETLPATNVFTAENDKRHFEAITGDGSTTDQNVRTDASQRFNRRKIYKRKTYFAIFDSPSGTKIFTKEIEPDTNFENVTTNVDATNALPKTQQKDINHQHDANKQIHSRNDENETCNEKFYVPFFRQHKVAIFYILVITGILLGVLGFCYTFYRYTNKIF